MADFPSIGKLIRPGYGETPAAGLTRTEMENGFVKQAQLTAGGLTEISVSYIFTATEYETFREFWRVTLRRGADFFSWRNPRDGTLYDVRIVGGEYSAQAITLAEGGQIGWQVDMTLEHWDDEPDEEEEEEEE